MTSFALWKCGSGVGSLASSADAAKLRCTASREELAQLRQSLEAAKQDAGDLEQSLKSITADTEKAKQLHGDRMQQLEDACQASPLYFESMLLPRKVRSRRHMQSCCNAGSLCFMQDKCHSQRQGALRLFWGTCRCELL